MLTWLVHLNNVPLMDASLLQRLAQPQAGLARLQRGIEKESLRVSTDGSLSPLDHPAALGSPLTHANITTDFSEAQLELIAGVHDTPKACLQELYDVHRFVYEHLGEERLWPSSMPCIISGPDGDDSHIPIGQYGSSNIGRAKSVYRHGLGLRYGRLMQTISGIHYNFSLPQSLWETLGLPSQDQQTVAYFDLIRNFRRWSWLLIYLFGASPAVCRSFTRNLDHNLEPLDEGSMYLPHATCLRMGRLGYQSNAQSALHISYNSLNQYAESMVEALTQKYPPYERHGTQDAAGNYLQLNTCILQIENEFYGTIRPKRRIQTGERPVTALQKRGVEYVEVRCLDLNPFLELGIDAQQIRFIDTFLLLCLLADSPPDSPEESKMMGTNQHLVVERGREPGLTLNANAQGDQRSLHDWASELLDQCEDLAAALDSANGGEEHMAALNAQRELVANAELTPSARMLATMREERIPFFRFSMNKADEHKTNFLREPIDTDEHAFRTTQAQASIDKQAEIERNESLSFDEFLVDYLAIDP